VNLPTLEAILKEGWAEGASVPMNRELVLRMIEVVKAARACDRQLSASALQPDSDDAVALRAALEAMEERNA
jgi:hypothetical protein